MCLATPAGATNTIYSVSYSGETAGMAGVANATQEDALSPAVNPANLSRIGSWRFDLGVGYLMSRVRYDDGGVNPDEFGYFEYQEGHDFVVPGFAYAKRLTPKLVVGAGVWGNGGDAIVYRGLGFNDTTPADLGGGLDSFMTNAADPAAGFGGLTQDNAVRRDNYATLQSGKVTVSFAYQVGPKLAVAVTPTLNIGVLRFGTFGNFATTGPESQVKGQPFGEFGDTTTYGELFAGDTFPKILLDGNGDQRIADLFGAVGSDATFGPALVNQLTSATVAAAGGDASAIPDAVAAALGNLTPDFSATFGDAGFGLSEMAGYAEGSGLSGFGYNTRFGIRWQVNDWLAIGANYSAKSRISMDHGTMNIDFTDQFRQAFNIGFRSSLAQQVLFGNLGNAFGTNLGNLANAYNTAGGLPDADGDGNQLQDQEDLAAAIGQLLGGFADAAAVDTVIPDNTAISAGATDVATLTAAADGLLDQFAFLLGFRDDVTQPFVQANVAKGPDGNPANVPNFGAISTADQVAFLNAVGIQIDAATLGAILDPASWSDSAFRSQMETAFGIPASLPEAEAFNAAFGALAQQLAVTQKMDTQVDFDLPQQAGVGVEIKATPRLTLGFDFTWIDFSDAFERFAARIDGGEAGTVIEKFLGLPESGGSFTFAQDFSWSDQYIIAVGGAWQATDALTLRLGYNHANNVVSADHSTPLFPAYGFETVAGGLTYTVGDHTRLSFAWEHAFDEGLKTQGNSKIDSQYDNADLNHNQDTAYLQVSWVY
ncbi:MAG: hypothetical protein D6739_01575 [Nitrospirae bacterium]|nr:MAG: hypothetical protein D6739_01575 [Nitrospirota bacterium]